MKKRRPDFVERIVAKTRQSDSARPQHPMLPRIGFTLMCRQFFIGLPPSEVQKEHPSSTSEGVFRPGSFREFAALANPFYFKERRPDPESFSYS